MVGECVCGEVQMMNEQMQQVIIHSSPVLYPASIGITVGTVRMAIGHIRHVAHGDVNINLIPVTCCALFNGLLFI